MTGEMREPEESELVRSSRPVSSRSRFLGLPGAPSSLNLQGMDRPRQREHPLFSPEHLSFRAPGWVLVGHGLGRDGIRQDSQDLRFWRVEFILWLLQVEDCRVSSVGNPSSLLEMASLERGTAGTP